MLRAIAGYLTAPVFADENRTRAANLLHILLLTTIPLTIAIILYSYFVSRTGFEGASTTLVALAIQVALFVLMRLGYVQTAGFLFSLTSWFIVSYAAYDTDGILNPIFGALTVIILIAGLVSGKWAALLILVLSIGSGIYLLDLARQGLLPAQYGDVPAAQAFTNHASVFIVAAVMLALARQHIQQSFARAQRELAERKRTEASLKESEKRYRTLFENNPHPMWVYDANTLAFLAVNQAAIRHYGYSQDEFLGMTLKDLCPKGAAPDLPEEGAVWQQRKKDGTLIHVEVSAHPMTYEGRDARMVLAYDITERKRMEDSLRESEARFRVALSSSPVVVFSQDRDLRYTWIYNSAQGLDPDSFIGKLDEDILTPDTRGPLTALKRRVLETGVGVRREVTASVEGVQRDYDLTIEPLYDADREIIGITCAAVDITERKRLHHHLMQAEVLKMELEKERQVVSLRENFVRSVSHEFRTPLSIILSSKEMLERYDERLTPESRREHLHKIGDEVDYMVQMLDNVLTISKAQAKGLEVNPRTLDIQAFCREVVAGVDDYFHNRREIIFTCDEQIGQQALDAKLLRYILVNLLSNAIQYSPPEQPVKVDVSQEETALIIRVQDFGIGIPADEQEHVFAPFYRGKNIGAVKGTGLGLAIVESSVEAYGGSIVLESQEGHGTTVTVSLPLR